MNTARKRRPLAIVRRWAFCALLSGLLGQMGCGMLATKETGKGGGASSSEKEAGKGSTQPARKVTSTRSDADDEEFYESGRTTSPSADKDTDDDPEPTVCEAGYRGKTTIYLHFDMISIKTGAADDAVSGTSGAAYANVVLPTPSLSETQKTDIASVIRQAFEKLHVEIVTTRPTRGTYTMVIFGGNGRMLGYDRTAGSRSVIDCTDLNKGNIVFVHPEIFQMLVPTNRFAEALAQAAIHELGHTFGLVDVMDPYDAMDPTAALPRSTVFQDKIVKVKQDGRKACDGGSTQNSLAVLYAVLGNKRKSGCASR